MTVSQLHALYCAGHREARSAAGWGTAASTLTIAGTGLTHLERVILEFALNDVVNGKPMRTGPEFERAVEQGAELLVSLGLELESLAVADAA